MAAAPGNQYAAKGKQWAMALERALDVKGAGDRRAALDRIATQVIDLAEQGERWAVEELGNRLDGKPAQAIIGGDADDNPIKVLARIERIIVDPSASNT